MVYIDDQGKETDYYPSTNGYTLTGSDTNTGSAKTNGFSTTTNTNWEIGVLNSADKNGGIYNFYVNTDVNGVPQNWYYEADQTKVVAYEVNESTHTTDAYLYCTRANTTGAYNKNFFGMVSFVKDGYLSFLFADKTYGRRKNSTDAHDQAVAADSPSAMQFSKDHLDTGIYTTEFNPTRDYIISGDMKPSRIFIIGSALNSNLKNTFTDWDPSNAVEMPYSIEEGCYKATVTLNKDKQFRFLLDHNQSGVATSLDNNFGEDSNKPGAGGDTDYNNKVQVESSSSSAGENIVFNPETNNYIVRFYVERKADKTGFQWTNDYGIYRYTIEKPERLNATITPPTATVNYAASLTPKVGVVGTTAEKRKYAFTIDGSDPTIDPATGEGTGKTVVRTYDYDAVVPTNDVYTFYMSATDQLTYLDVDGTEHTLDGNTVTVKAQAVQTITEGSKSRLEGDIATGTYVFKTAGIKPAGSYTISVKNDDETNYNAGIPSINKVKATVTVKNEKGEDDGVDVYYTIDGTDPVAVGNVNARLVNKDRKINVYGIVNLVHGAKNYIRVAIAGSPTMNGDDGKTHASCEYDLTCSTSEGGYINYRDGYTNPSLKTYGGDGHIVVYILPWSSNQTTYAQKPTNPTPKSVENCTNFRVPFIYAYENIDKDGVVESKALTHATHTIDVLLDEVFGLPTIEKGGSKCYWSYVDLVPDNDDKEVNIEMGYYDMITNELKLTPATIANVHNDMFLEFDVATGQIKDVTHKYTKDYFYTIGESGTKREAANPKANEHFFFVQVPEAWTINGNSVKVLQNGTELSGANVTVQGSAETSCLSKVCKISVPATLAEGTSLTIQPYNGKNGSSQKLTVNYVNGGYYFYESALHYTKDAPLVFGADADDDKDQRPKGRRDVNHTLETQPAKRVAGTGYMGYGDYTYYLTPHWKDGSNNEVPTTNVTDNWNGESATVNTIAAGTTISQTVDLHTAGQGLYTVQMIVRGKEGAKATLQLVGSDYTVKGEKKGNSSASVSKTFAGYDAQGTVTTDGRVEYLLKTDTKNGWQKLETVASVGSEGKLKISLTADGGELQLSDVTLLCNANTPPDVLGEDDGKPIYYYRPTIWTTAPTGKDVTEYDLTARQSANAFSFFDRGDNRNAVIYADKNTVLGMSENTYNVAVPIYDDSEESPAKHGTVFRSSGSDPGKSEPDYWKGKALVWEDEPDAWVNNNSWGTTVYTIWNGFRWNRKFLGTTTDGPGARNTIFLPFSMSENQIKAIFGDGAKVYSIESVDAPKLKVTGIQATRTNLETYEQETGTEANVPYILELPETKDGVSYDDELDTEFSKYENYSNATLIGDQDHPQGEFVGVYKYTNITSKSDGTYDYYCYDAERNGIFNFFSNEGADIKPFRAYLKIDRSAGSKPFYYFVVDEGGTTGIDGVSATTLTDDAPVYNLQGQLVRKAGQHTQLPKGLYIQKGRKFVQQ
ncbi:hypothetical protein PRLR5107_05500 [Prevotella lacticifex]|uniref:Uncharacterized protein n=1 Tax=Prevotella lacticifex TaxID=2854755 RepID=A0A9R1CZN3_9BACT|nr:hypothetical protein PRLR5003_13540 [Prevotella lacticifex]GJG38056.1 hypothetical protein PRLR5019_00270 [Prevotella lacticifex]GJG43261.1 hypothetical protein PRLR5025_20470 [Prevotella lacticifex]GJG44413.1 hypothetical protein PRLR5027_00080 [Prevotella lacticifex]GJG49612.1 hypothetical protein PRLR5052_20250 [Prevotella lacticifex]